MGKKQAARKRKWRPPESPVRIPSESDASCEETSRTSAAAVTEPMTSPKKPTPFHCAWSEENEITLLNSFLQFEQCEKGADRSADSRKEWNASITESLGRQFTEAQVTQKLSNLKRKFLGSSDRRPSSSFSPSRHERKIFKLSAKIWGQSGAAASHHDMQPKSRSSSRVVDDDLGSKAQTNYATAVDSSQQKRVRNSDSKEGSIPNSNSKEGPVPNSNLKEGPVLNFDLEFEKLDFGAISDILGKAIECMGQVGMDKRMKRLKKEIQVAELEVLLKKGELLKQQLTRVLECSSSGT